MRSTLELADIINKFYDEPFRQRIPVYKQRTLGALTQCRTAALGGHIDACDRCDHTKISYNSCRNRHCPKCQGLKKEMWAIQREEELLPIAYFHLVFTLPHELNGLCSYNPRLMYNLLFESAWYVLQTFANDPLWLGAKSAATMVLHTWSQKLTLHPHVHCIVPSGGLAADGKWQRSRKGNANFLYPVLAMNQVYKAYFLKILKGYLKGNELKLPKKSPIGKAYYNWKEILYKKEWVVYTKPPFGGAHNVVKYLSRYSHRAAITNQRITDITDDQVTFRYNDYKAGGIHKPTTVNGQEFLKRFCHHILPPRFRKVRHRGFLANASKKKSLTLARRSLGEALLVAMSKQERKDLAKQRIFGVSVNHCPCCKKGQMITMDVFAPNKDPPIAFMSPNDVNVSF